MKGGATIMQNATVQDHARKLLENSPKLETPYQQFLFDCFFTLTTERQLGMSSAGPIPVMSIIKYAEFEGLDTRETRAFVKVIRSMDLVYTNYIREKANAESKKSAQSSKR